MLPSTSPRVMRVISARGTVARVTAGRMRWLTASPTSAGLPVSAASTTLRPVGRAMRAPTGISPPTGSQPSFAENSSSAISPSQNTGMETPNSVGVVIAVSTQVPSRNAANTPSGTPIAVASASADRVSCRVTGNACSTSPKAERLSRNDVPKSPDSAPERKRQYCTITG